MLFGFLKMKKKHIVIMKKEYFIVIIMIIIVLVAPFILNNITGKVIGGPEEGMRGLGDIGSSGGGFGEPSEEDMACMVECTTRECDVSDMDCRIAKSSACGNECGVDTKQPEPADEGEKCMQECIKIGCDKYDISCQNKNINSCENKCNMKGDALDEFEIDAEQICISNCVAAEDPLIICGSSKEGETGVALCQKCATECVHLYEGACLNDEQLTEKENKCISKCEHCYGEPVEGPSGEGWDCIIDVKCGDASSEFGDESGTGPGIGQEGFVANIGGAIGNVFEGIGNFFKGLFGGE